MAVSCVRAREDGRVDVGASLTPGAGVGRRERTTGRSLRSGHRIPTAYSKVQKNGNWRPELRSIVDGGVRRVEGCGRIAIGGFGPAARVHRLVGPARDPEPQS